MLSELKKAIYGDITPEEVKKFTLLSLTFFFTIGAYWLLRPLKDGIFFNMVGSSHQPNAKILSVCVILPLVLIYSKLVDIFEKHKLFYVIGSFYFIIFFISAILLGHSEIGLANPERGPHRWIAWFIYVTVESFGSIMVALFWSFVASITEPESAKRGFPLVVTGAQIGGLVGPVLAYNAEHIGMQNLFFIGALYPAIMVGMVMYFMAVTPKDQLTTKQSKAAEGKPKTGFLEGLKLLLTRPYLFGVFVIVSLYEVVSTIIDFQMKTQASALPEYSTYESLTRFMGIFGFATNAVALTMALLGTSYIMRRFGLLFCLLAFPALVGLCFIGLYTTSITPGISQHMLMWITFTVMITAKGLSYGFNNPAKEMMYIPTSKDAKYKTKSWIDMFGSRSSKALGSALNNSLKPLIKTSGMPAFITYGTLTALGILGFWIAAALFVGRKFTSLTKNNEIIE